MAVVIPLKLVYTPVDATVTAIRNYQVPSSKYQALSVAELRHKDRMCCHRSFSAHARRTRTRAREDVAGEGDADGGFAGRMGSSHLNVLSKSAQSGPSACDSEAETQTPESFDCTQKWTFKGEKGKP